MSVTILSYIDQTLADNITAQAIARAEQAKAAAAAAAKTSETDFASVLEDATNTASTTQNTSSAVLCPEDLETIFAEAAETYNVSEKLLKCIAKTESNFNANAVSNKGAVGIMQLMPSTAASLGVSNSYDARENIMGGAKLIAQLLIKYEGNVSLALAAYNAGSNSVDTYGGIPPYSETQNYVTKVLSYMDTDITIPAATDTAYPYQTPVSASDTTETDTEPETTDTASADTSSKTPSGQITVTVLNSIDPAYTTVSASDVDETDNSEDTSTGSSDLSSLAALTGEDREKANAALEAFFAARGISLEKLQALVNQMTAEQQA